MIHGKYPPRVLRTLRHLGRNINIARRRRRESQQQFADRMGISTGTLKRLEKGDPGIGIGQLAMAFLVLGEINRLDEMLAFDTDSLGLMLDLDRLPKRIHQPHSRSAGDRQRRLSKGDDSPYSPQGERGF